MNKRLSLALLIFLGVVVLFGRSRQDHLGISVFDDWLRKGIASISDSIPANPSTDSIAVDSLHKNDIVSPTTQNQSLEYPIDIKAEDSIVLYGNGTAFIYGKGQMVYKEASAREITADFISVNMDSNYFHAEGVPDTAGLLHGTPIFKEGSQEYRAKAISYNFKTEKGFIRGAKTQEGEGYILADQTKKGADGFMNMKNGKYTTCDNDEHPHFYLNLTKGRVKPKSYVATGPAYMVVEDIPLPLAIPFGFFPFTSRYSSGIIMPSYGDEMEAGFFLKGGGYYFAINDYIDLALTGDIYTKGSWGLQLASKYRKRYAYDGSINIRYNNIVRGEKMFPDYNVSKDFRIDWTHRQDSKASPFSNFSASVNFFTSGYNRNSIDYNYSPAQQSQAVSSSSVNFTQRVPSAPITFSVNASIRQSVRDSSVAITLPNLRMDLSTIYPFKRKNRVGKERFYEKLSFSYSMEFANSFNGKENKVFHSDFAKDWNSGILHSPNVQLPLSIFKYITVNPQFRYTERWYFKKVEQHWDKPTQSVRYDTVGGFYRAYDFSTGISFSTTLYGFYSPIQPLKKALGIGDIRHVLKPSVSFTYTPDFSDPIWKMYNRYDKEIVDKNSGEVRREQIIYSPYSSGKYGTAPKGRNQRLNISFDNNVEMKVKDKVASDTSENVVYKKISLIDNLSIRGGYNFVADSLNMDNISASVRLKITNSYSITLSTQFEPYMYGLSDRGTPVRINKYRWQYGKMPWFTGTSTSFSYTLNNATFKKKKKDDGKTDDTSQVADNEGDEFNVDPSQQNNPDTVSNEKRKLENDLEGYQKADFQWSMSLNLGLGWGKNNDFNYEKMEYHRSFNGGIMGISGYVNPTSNWQFNYSASVDMLKTFRMNSLSLSIRRNLHCWNLSASVTPIGYYKSFMVTIGANASMLQDLKYDKRQRDNIEIK